MDAWNETEMADNVCIMQNVVTIQKVHRLIHTLIYRDQSFPFENTPTISLSHKIKSEDQQKNIQKYLKLRRSKISH